MEGKKVAMERLPAFINKNNLLVAELEDEIVALLYFERSFFDTELRNNWFLTQITVKNGFRRKGIGEKMWRYFLFYAKENGASSVFADIQDFNIASLNLAKKIGGVEVGFIDLGAGDIKKFFRFDI
jgi:L-amino acid N-acyltransferase YncA